MQSKSHSKEGPTKAKAGAAVADVWGLQLTAGMCSSLRWCSLMGGSFVALCLQCLLSLLTSHDSCTVLQAG